MDDLIPSIQIAELDQHTNHRAQAVEWLHTQWGASNRDEFDEALRTRSDCLPALVALYHDQPIGVLAYKLHAMKSRTTDDLWINALFVEASWRGRGVGRGLVEEGVRRARAFGRSAIYVYTDVPEFYERNKWQRFSYNQETSMHVLEFRFD